MQKIAISKIFKRSRHSLLFTTPRQSKAGFTLVEVLVVVGLAAVLAAISAPSWLGFVQQRRVTSANDAVVRALQEAQSKAKTQKLSYSVSFINEGGIPKVAVYRDSATNINNYWKQLGEQFSLKPGQVILGTNIDNPNSASGNTLTYLPSTSAPPATPPTQKITFDYTGGLPTNPSPNLGNNGLILVVAAPQPNTNNPIPSTVRCVSVKTLLGSIQAGKIDSQGQCSPIR